MSTRLAKAGDISFRGHDVMSQNLDPYAVLGVSRTATQAQISHAFRTKVRALHPDTSQAGSAPSADATAQLRQLLGAYDALRHCGRRDTTADPAAGAASGHGGGPSSESAPFPDSQAPVKIPVTYRRGPSAAFREGVWAGPVRRHR